MTKIDALEGQYIKLNGFEIFYQQIGEGDALILLHGGGLTSSIWSYHQPILAEQFHVFTPDLRGHGRTNNPSGVLSYQIMAADVLRFIKALKLEKPFICGWSMGAGVALEFAMKFPDKAQALVCCGGGPPLAEAEIEELIQDEEQLMRNPEIARRMKEMHSHVHGPDYWQALVRQLHNLLRLGYSEHAFNKIIVPTLVLCGDREERPGVEAYLALTRELPQGELKVIPYMDHDYPISNVESFSKTITDFFLKRGD